MRNLNPTYMQQIHVGVGPDGFEPVAEYNTDKATYAREHEELQASLRRINPANIWHNGSNNAGCPRPILIGKHHQQQLTDLHEALTTAITDIVRRWHTDSDARFPERMPLEPYEDELLQWLEGQVLCGNLQDISACLGSWRPDFLVDDHKSQKNGPIEENFRITEINARFSFNGFMHEAYGQKALDDMGVENLGLISATSAEEIIGGLFSLFNPALPLHLLKGEEAGIDIHMFIDIVKRRFGVTPRLITPEDLRLEPNSQGKGGYKLYCVIKNPVDLGSIPNLTTNGSGEVLEEIHQVGLELHQRELQAMESNMLRQISLRCFNDMRTVLLIHDKRMLGIVKQELHPLVARQVLTPVQAQVLEKGIADTILPGSTELQELIQLSKDAPGLRHEYILKPVRSGKGAGIVFGEDFLSNDEWISALDRLRSPKIIPGICVVQRRIIPRLYDVVLQASGARGHGAVVVAAYAPSAVEELGYAR